MAGISRKERYLRQLKRTGFRSWKKANDRRAKLIIKDVDENISPLEKKELNSLQTLGDLYVQYKTKDALGKYIRALEKWMKAHGIAD